MSERNISYIERKWPAYYVTRTLMGGSPDQNTRTIYRYTHGGHYPVAKMKGEYETGWTAENERLLNVMVKALIEDAGPVPILVPQYWKCIKCGYYHHISVDKHDGYAFQENVDSLNIHYGIGGWQDVTEKREV